MPLTRVQLDVDRALRTGITPAQVGQTLRLLHGEDKITEFRRGEDLVQVVLDRAAEPSRALAALGDTLVPSATGGLVALKDAGTATLGTASRSSTAATISASSRSGPTWRPTR